MNIENYFVSSEFMNALIPLYGRVNDFNILDVVEYVISCAIKFSSYNNFSLDGIDEYVRALVNKLAASGVDKDSFSTSSIDSFASKLSFDLILKRLGVSKDNLDDFEVQDKVCKYVIENVRLKNYIYHAFNSTAYESIKNNGLSPNIRLTEQSEIDKINALFEKHGIKSIFGWQKINCEGRVSFSRTPSVSYDYAVRSPEWFSQFCGGTHAYMDIEDKRVMRAFQMGDYEGAKKNIFSLMSLHRFSADEMQMVFDFFDSNWKKYGNKECMLAVVKDTLMESDSSVDDLSKRYIDLGYSVQEIYGFSSYSSSIDDNTKRVIDVNDAIFIKLPSYREMHNKLSNANIKGILQILSNSKIYFETDEDGKRVLKSKNGEEEVKLVKDILGNNDVYQYILNDQSGRYDGWLPYFNSEIINCDENIIGIAQKKNFYFWYVDAEKRNNPELMKKCLKDGCSKSMLYMVGPQVLDDLDFISLLIIKMNDSEFDFASSGIDNIAGSRMGYGKIIGKSVQTNSKFWRLLNSKIKLINKKFGLNTSLFDESKEIVLASRYFDELKKEKN